MKNKLALILGSTTLAVISTVLTVSVQAASAGEVKSQVTGLCLDSDPTGHVYTKGCNGGGYQNWNFTRNGSNYFLENAATRRCLDSDGSGYVYTKECNNGGYQNWEFSGENFGRYKNTATGRCLDSDNNGEVYAYGCHLRYKGQRWHS
jgi:hypothetical protein